MDALAFAGYLRAPAAKKVRAVTCLHDPPWKSLPASRPRQDSLEEAVLSFGLPVGFLHPGFCLAAYRQRARLWGARCATGCYPPGALQELFLGTLLASTGAKRFWRTSRPGLSTLWSICSSTTAPLQFHFCCVRSSAELRRSEESGALGRTPGATPRGGATPRPSVPEVGNRLTFQTLEESRNTVILSCATCDMDHP